MSANISKVNSRIKGSTGRTWTRIMNKRLQDRPRVEYRTAPSPKSPPPPTHARAPDEEAAEIYKRCPNTDVAQDSVQGAVGVEQ